MAYDIIIGRDAADKERFGDRGLIYLGKSFVKMGTYTSLSNKLWLDIARSHVILIAGKRGSGKSYSLSVIAEELSALPSDVAGNIASLIFDTMGIFWSMKYKNERDAALLKEWELAPRSLPVKVMVPFGKVDDYRERDIPVDATFALSPSELAAEEWIALFNLDFTSLPAVLIERVITSLREQHRSFAMSDIIAQVEADAKANAANKEMVSALFSAAQTWGIFAAHGQGTSLRELLTPATTTVLDISVYSSSLTFNIRALVIALLARKLFYHRLAARKQEELETLHSVSNAMPLRRQEPLVWLFIDEAQEFLPRDGKTPATDALVQLLREGRQPGISLVLATQQPGQIHRDATSQADIVLAHRVTAKADIAALNEIMQSYVLESIRQQFDNLPPLKGSAIILDDNSERIIPMRVRPKFTWHGGESPAAVAPEPKI